MRLFYKLLFLANLSFLHALHGFTRLGASMTGMRSGHDSSHSEGGIPLHPAR